MEGMVIDMDVLGIALISIATSVLEAQAINHFSKPVPSYGPRKGDDRINIPSVSKNMSIESVEKHIKILEEELYAKYTYKTQVPHKDSSIPVNWELINKGTFHTVWISK